MRTRSQRGRRCRYERNRLCNDNLTVARSHSYPRQGSIQAGGRRDLEIRESSQKQAIKFALACWLPRSVSRTTKYLLELTQTLHCKCQGTGVIGTALAGEATDARQTRQTRSHQGSYSSRPPVRLVPNKSGTDLSETSTSPRERSQRRKEAIAHLNNTTRAPFS